MADDVQVKFGANIDGVVEGINSVAHKLKDLSVLVRELAEGFGELRKTFVEAFAVMEIAEFVEHIAELGEQAVRSSAMLGMSVESVEKLGFAAKMTGGDADGMAMGLLRLERNMAEAQSGSGKAFEAFQELGISLNDLKTKAPDQILGKIADAFRGAEDGAAKTAIAMDLMGRSGAQMIPILDQGNDGLRQMGLVAEQTGSVMTTLQAEGLETTAREITTLKASVQGAGISLMEVFKPAIDAAIQGLTSLVQVFRSVIEMIRFIVDRIEGGLAVALAATIEKFEEFGLEVANVFDNIKIKVSEVSSVLDELAHGHLQAAVDAQRAGEAQLAQSNANTTKQIASLGKQYDDLKTKIVDATLAALTFGNAEQKDAKTQLHAPTSGGSKEDDSAEKDEIAIERSDLQTSLELYRLDVAAKKDADDAKVASGKLSKQAELADLISLVGQERELALKEITDERDLYDQDSVNWVELDNKKLVAEQQYANEIARLSAQMAQAQAQAAKKSAEEWKPVLDTIGRDFDSMLQGVLQGTETWQQAMGKLFSNIAVSAVEAIAKITAEWLIFMVATEGQGTWSSFVALEKPGGAGVSSLLPSFDVGSWSVPQTGPAFIHAGEMIIPASQASAIRSGDAGMGTSGSAGNFTININAIDTQTGAQFLKQNASVIAQSMAGQMRNFNSSLRN